MSSRLDLADIAKRRRDLFPRETGGVESGGARGNVVRVAHTHCGACPHADDEICVLDCGAYRAKLKLIDGVSVS